MHFLPNDEHHWRWKLHKQIEQSRAITESPIATLPCLFSALHIFLSITASLGNSLILAALHKVSSVYLPTKLFFRYLVVTDLCIGLLVHSLFATVQLSCITEVNEDVLYYMYEVSRASGWIFSAVSVLMATAIGVDRPLALLMGLRYRHVVTLTRVRVAIFFCFWFIGACIGSIPKWGTDITLVLASVVLTLSLVTSIFCYTRIHLKLRHRQVQDQNSFPVREGYLWLFYL